MKILACLFAFGSLMSGTGFQAENQTFAQSDAAIQKKDIEENTDSNVVLSYENVLFDYYADALDYKTKIGSRFVDFDEFCKTYYDNNINIQLYMYIL